MNQTSVKGYLRFIGDPARGPKYECEIWRASVRADGAIGFISDEYSSFSLTGDISPVDTATWSFTWTCHNAAGDQAGQDTIGVFRTVLAHTSSQPVARNVHLRAAMQPAVT